MLAHGVGGSSSGSLHLAAAAEVLQVCCPFGDPKLNYMSRQTLISFKLTAALTHQTCLHRAMMPR